MASLVPDQRTWHRWLDRIQSAHAGHLLGTVEGMEQDALFRVSAAVETQADLQQITVHGEPPGDSVSATTEEVQIATSL